MAGLTQWPTVLANSLSISQVFIKRSVIPVQPGVFPEYVPTWGSLARNDAQCCSRNSSTRRKTWAFRLTMVCCVEASPQALCPLSSLACTGSGSYSSGIASQTTSTPPSPLQTLLVPGLSPYCHEYSRRGKYRNLPSSNNTDTMVPLRFTTRELY